MCVRKSESVCRVDVSEVVYVYPMHVEQKACVQDWEFVYQKSVVLGVWVYFSVWVCVCVCEREIEIETEIEREEVCVGRGRLGKVRLG